MRFRGVVRLSPAFVHSGTTCTYDVTHVNTLLLYNHLLLNTLSQHSHVVVELIIEHEQHEHIDLNNYH